MNKYAWVAEEEPGKNERMDEWMNEWINEWLNEWINE